MGFATGARNNKAEQFLLKSRQIGPRISNHLPYAEMLSLFLSTTWILECADLGIALYSLFPQEITPVQTFYMPP